MCVEMKEIEGISQRRRPRAPLILDLGNLPNELLNNIASYLSNSELLQLRALHNRNICNGIDRAFVSNLACKS